MAAVVRATTSGAVGSTSETVVARSGSVETLPSTVMQGVRQHMEPATRLSFRRALL